jgi:hypothetical protein
VLEDLAGFLQEIDGVPIRVWREFVSVAQNFLNRRAITNHTDVF